jgi:hypothetical protein
MNEWIKCSDRMPDLKNKDGSNSCSEDVLIIESDETMYVANLVYLNASGYRKEERYYWKENSTGCGCCAEDLFPEYWMPLPTPPKQTD